MWRQFPKIRFASFGVDLSVLRVADVMHPIADTVTGNFIQINSDVFANLFLAFIAAQFLHVVF